MIQKLTNKEKIIKVKSNKVKALTNVRENTTNIKPKAKIEKVIKSTKTKSKPIQKVIKTTNKNITLNAKLKPIMDKDIPLIPNRHFTSEQLLIFNPTIDQTGQPIKDKQYFIRRKY